jgi:hypothetical protein
MMLLLLCISRVFNWGKVACQTEIVSATLPLEKRKREREMGLKKYEIKIPLFIHSFITLFLISRGKKNNMN